MKIVLTSFIMPTKFDPHLGYVWPFTLNATLLLPNCAYCARLGVSTFHWFFICAQSVPEFLWDRLRASIQFTVMPKRAQYARFSGECAAVDLQCIFGCHYLQNYGRDSYFPGQLRSRVITVYFNITGPCGRVTHHLSPRKSLSQGGLNI